MANGFLSDFSLLFDDAIDDVSKYNHSYSYTEEGGLVSTIWDAIKEFIIGLIIPDEDYWSNTYNELTTLLNDKVPYQDYLDTLSYYTDIDDNTINTDNIDVSVSLSGFQYGDETLSMENFIDFGFLSEYRETWYVWVRVIVYLALLFFNISNLMKLLDSSGSIINGYSRVEKSINSKKGDE